MIKEFNDVEVRDSGIVYKSTWEQIKMLYAQNPQLAGELAISVIELVLTGQMSSDDFTVQLVLKNIEVINEKNKQKYEKKIENQKQTRIESLKLDVIADLMKEGLTQAQIGNKIGETQRVVSYRKKIIETEFPELLIENYTNYTKYTNNDNDTETENDNNLKLVCQPILVQSAHTPPSQKTISEREFKAMWGVQ